jgi:hypothetical protein
MFLRTFITLSHILSYPIRGLTHIIWVGVSDRYDERLPPLITYIRGCVVDPS